MNSLMRLRERWLLIFSNILISEIFNYPATLMVYSYVVAFSCRKELVLIFFSRGFETELSYIVSKTKDRV